MSSILKHEGKIKISDFGLSKILGDNELTGTYIGSNLNIAPEIISCEKYNQKCDIFSIGVCFYQMLFGRYPFEDENITYRLEKIKKGNIDFSRESEISQ